MHDLHRLRVGQESMRRTVRETEAPWSATVIVEGNDWWCQLEGALATIRQDRVAPPDLVILFVSGHLESAYPAMVHRVHHESETRTLVGCTGKGVISAGKEVEKRPCLSLMGLWLPGSDVRPVRLDQEQIALFADPGHWHEINDIEFHPETSWFVLAEPFRIDAQAVIDGFAEMYPRSPIIGGMASSIAEPRASSIFIDDRVYSEGGVAIAFKPPYAIVPFVSHGCDLVGEAWTITDIDRNTILTISNRPALDVLNETVALLVDENGTPSRHRTVVGFAVDEYKDEFHCSDFVVRGILGLDEERGGIVVGGKPRIAQTIQFHQRHPQSADVELHQVLAEARASMTGRHLVAGLLCSCAGRGRGLFGSPNHDAMAVQRAFDALPVTGLLCLGEIAPVCGRTMLQAFTASLGLLTRDATSP